MSTTAQKITDSRKIERYRVLSLVLYKGLSLITMIFGLLVLTFLIGRILPIDPVIAIIGDNADQSTYEQMYRQLGLDRPLWVQFGTYVGNMLTGDFGVATLTGHEVLDDIGRVFPATFELAVFTIIIGVSLGVPLGIVAAVKRGSIWDHIVRVLSLSGYSMPVFWLALIGLFVFYAQLGWVGGSGRQSMYYVGIAPTVTGMILVDSLLAGEWDLFWDALRHIILPAGVLGYSSMAYLSRMTRSFMLEQLSQEYIITARVKGLSSRSVIWGHAFRNIRVQLLTIVALTFGSLLDGAVLVESVFAWPGFGQYLVSALQIGDMNAVLGSVMIIGLIFISLNFLSDILYRVFDPRTR